MKVIIVTGSREWTRQAVIFRALDAEQPELVVHGAAWGADHIAHRWAVANAVDEHAIRAKWRLPDGGIDRRAGHQRNHRMLLAYPGALVLAFPLGESHGTRGCMTEAARRGHAVKVYDEEGGLVLFGIDPG
jgi:hypothetical protein